MYHSKGFSLGPLVKVTLVLFLSNSAAHLVVNCPKYILAYLIFSWVEIEQRNRHGGRSLVILYSPQHDICTNLSFKLYCGPKRSRQKLSFGHSKLAFFHSTLTLFHGRLTLLLHWTFSFFAALFLSFTAHFLLRCEIFRALRHGYTQDQLGLIQTEWTPGECQFLCC